MAGGIIEMGSKEYDVFYLAYGGECEILSEVRDHRMKVIIEENVESLRSDLAGLTKGIRKGMVKIGYLKEVNAIKLVNAGSLGEAKTDPGSGEAGEKLWSGFNKQIRKQAKERHQDQKVLDEILMS